MSATEDYNSGMDARLFGMRVKMSRDDLGLTQTQLAKRVNVSRPYITKIEKGRETNVGIAIIEALAKELEVTVEYLLGLTENPLPPKETVQIGESHVIYEIASPADRHLAQRLLDDFLALAPRDREVVISVAATLRESSTSRIVGDE